MESINKIFQVIEYMNEHIFEEVSLDDLCVASGYSKPHLCNMFKLYLGKTPGKYFYQQKLKHGANLLFGHENVLDIAVKVGFGSHEAFSRAFKKEFGMTPIAYREMYHKGLSKIDDLNDMELTIAFSASPSYRVFQGLSQYGKYYDVYQSLIKKGYINEQDLELTLKGKQLSDKYYWDCSELITALSNVNDTLTKLYENTIKMIYIPKLLFYNFVYDLVDVGKIKNVFLGRCGSDCFKCDTLTATLTDDDELRKKLAVKSKEEFHIAIDYTQVNCFGCTSDSRSESCRSNCPWTPCCEKHSVMRCCQCSQYPCRELNELFTHLPEFRDNFHSAEI